MERESFIDIFLYSMFNRRHTKDEFSQLLKKIIIGNVKNDSGSDFAGIVSCFYTYLSLHNGWGRKRNSFEAATVSILADPDQHRTEVSGYSLGDIVWDGMRDLVAFQKSPNVANGRLAKQLMRKIDLEAIASGELRHTNVQSSSDERVNQSSPEYRAQRILTNLLFQVQQKGIPGREYWEKVAGNPSFIEIKHHLAAALREPEAKEMLPEVLNFYRQMLKGSYAMLGFEKFVRSYSPITRESIAFKRMKAAEKAVSEGLKTGRAVDVDLGGIYHLAWPALTETNRSNSVLLLTDLKQTCNTVNVEYLRIDDSGIYRGLKASMELEEITGRGTILPDIGEIPPLIISRSDMPVNPDIHAGEKRMSYATIKPKSYESISVFMLTAKVQRFLDGYERIFAKAA